MNMHIPILEAVDLSIGHTSPILSHLNFKIFPGDLICLMGANGCGKTTLLKTFMKLSPILGGDVFLSGKTLHQHSSIDLAKIISVVLTDKIDLPHSTVFDVVAFGRSPHTNFWGSLKFNDKEIIQQSLELLGITPIQDHLFNELSDGQKQKVMIARALAQNTPILLLDEPTTHLDIQRKMELLQILRTVARTKKVAILFSSHDWELVLETISWIWFIHPRGDIKIGIPEDLILKNEIADCFLAEHFFFDPKTGGLREKLLKRNKISITLSENLIRNRWTIHALEKMGFELNENSLIKLQIKDDRWILNDISCLSLEELLNNLRQF